MKILDYEFTGDLKMRSGPLELRTGSLPTM